MLRRSSIFLTAVLLLVLVVRTARASDSTDATNIVELEGRVRRAPTPGTNLLFRTTKGAEYHLARTVQAEALFLDTNLYSKVLLLKGKLVPKNSFEITANLRSIKDGKENELYYYCDICSITTSIPGLCQCCREPVVLVEKPITGK